MAAPPAYPNSVAAQIGYLLGQGYPYAEIAKKLDDGTTAEQVRGACRYWGIALRDGRPAGSAVRVLVDQRVRARLKTQAARVGVSPGEYLRRICVCAVNDDMYGAIVDGAFG